MDNPIEVRRPRRDTEGVLAEIDAVLATEAGAYFEWNV